MDSDVATSVSSDAALVPRVQATCPSVRRDVPTHWDERQREQIVEIAQRVKAEHCASYTLICLGIQAYARNAHAHAQDASAQ